MQLFTRVTLILSFYSLSSHTYVQLVYYTYRGDVIAKVYEPV